MSANNNKTNQTKQAPKKKPLPKSFENYIEARNYLTSQLKNRYAEMMSVAAKVADVTATSLGFDLAARIQKIGVGFVLNDWDVVPPYRTSELFSAYVKRQQDTLDSEKVSKKVRAAVSLDLKNALEKLVEINEDLL